jgi:hypothetical protein
VVPSSTETFSTSSNPDGALRICRFSGSAIGPASTINSVGVTCSVETLRASSDNSMTSDI